jgi:hypothetical protein
MHQDRAAFDWLASGYSVVPAAIVNARGVGYTVEAALDAGEHVVGVPVALVGRAKGNLDGERFAAQGTASHCLRKQASITAIFLCRARFFAPMSARVRR